MLRYKLDKFKLWWQSHSVKEQYMLLVGAIFILGFLIYLFYWSPLEAASVRMRHQITSNEQLLAWMEATRAEIKTLEARSHPEATTYSPVEALSLIQNKVENAGLSEQLTELKQGSKDTIDLNFKAVEFDKLSMVLIEITKMSGLRVIQISVKPTRTLGYVNAEINIGT